MESVNIAVERTGDWTGRMGRTGIDKRPSGEPIDLADPDADSGSGVLGDLVVDTRHHGGRDQAVYAFDVEDLRYWSRRLGKDLAPGNAGENLTVAGCDASNAVIGQRWRVGSALLRVTAPRVPCRVFAGYWDMPNLVKIFSEYGRTGSYFAVEQGGAVASGDAVEVLSTPEHGVTVGEAFAFVGQGRRDLLDHLETAMSDLPGELARRVSAARGSESRPV
ncbi:MOSC domain-containing protein [Allosaccharopolyspora coralli]|uniref:MOSC domain-containing protein n=1 Tax=Allosaccharopolyspora coralli TaxID=2665642 RepID=A0A5Q3QKP2_9PSEU|nr:MOSC domain-containing protein [Allosaccharopolyspora coralli]